MADEPLVKLGGRTPAGSPPPPPKSHDKPPPMPPPPPGGRRMSRITELEVRVAQLEGELRRLRDLAGVQTVPYVIHGVECYEAWRNEQDCPHEPEGDDGQDQVSADAAASPDGGGKQVALTAGSGRKSEHSSRPLDAATSDTSPALSPDASSRQGKDPVAPTSVTGSATT